MEINSTTGNNAERKRLFDTVASDYGKLRPTYSADLYDTIFKYHPIGESSIVAEIGIGSGQATRPFLESGCHLTAIEPGENFSRICRAKFSGFPNFKVLTSTFEEAPLKKETFDLVYSASAFHWIPEEVGYTKVYSVLKSGGVFARFANHPALDKGNPKLIGEIENLYAKYYYPFYDKEPVKRMEYTQEEAMQKAVLARKYGFENIRCALFYGQRTFRAKEYTALLGTYSDHIAIEEEVRKAFFKEIEEAIEGNGGFITLRDTMDLQLARKV